MNKTRILFAAAIFASVSAIAVAQQPGIGSNTPSTFAIPIDNKAPTFGAGKQGLVIASSATDIFTLCGASGRVTRVSRVEVSGRATNAASVDVSLVLRSTANSGGTSMTVSATKYDSTYAAAAAVATSYTANPTLGTNAGGSGAMLAVKQLFLGNLTTGQPGTSAEWTFGNRPSSQIALRSTAQCLAVNLNAQSASGSLFDVWVEWTEFGN